MKNKLIIIAMLFCVLLTLSAVSASDIANDDNAVQVSSEDNIELSTVETVNEDTNVVEDVVGETIDPQATEIEETLKATNDNEEKIGEDGGQYNTTDVNNYAELSGLFASGKMGRTSQNLTVNLLGDEEYTVTKEITIQTVNTDKLRNLIINGNGRVINGNDAYRFIRVGTYKGGVNLTINNLTIKNCYKSASGGAIYMTMLGHSNLTINNVNFENNRAGEDGGAIDFYGVSLTITNSNFTSNYGGYQGGAVYANLDDDGFLNVDNCIFTNNHANSNDENDGDGGAIRYQDGQGTISNCKFSGNTAMTGGAIYAYDQDLTDENVCKLNIINCDFTQNTASGEEGGAIYNKAQVEVTNSNFTSNSATNGSDIYSDKNTVLKIENCNIDEDNLFTDEGCVLRNFNVIVPDVIAKDSPVTITVTESGGFLGTVKVLLGTEEVSIPFMNGGGSATVTPNLAVGKYNATLVYKESEEAAETSVVIKEFTVKVDSIKYNILNNISGNVAIEILVYDDAGEEVTGTELVTLKIGENTIGTVKPFRVYKNTELAPGNYTITAIFSENSKNISLTVEADPFAALNETQEALNIANEKVGNLTAKLDELNQTLNQTQEDLNIANEKVGNLTSKVDELNQTLNQTQEDLNTANEKVGNLTTQIDAIADQITALNDALNQTQEALKNTTAQVNSLSSQAEELKANNTNLQNSLNTAKAENTKLTKKAAQTATLKKVKSAKKLKKTAKKYKITATLSKKLKGKKISFIFNGKVYTKKTNAKGIAKLTIKKSVIKKLKTGKFVYYVSYGEKVLKKSIKVKK